MSVVSAAVSRALAAARNQARYKSTRELSLAITKLEEAEMWAKKDEEVN